MNDAYYGPQVRATALALVSWVRGVVSTKHKILWSFFFLGVNDSSYKEEVSELH
jgi:hypothetical protein